MRVCVRDRCPKGREGRWCPALGPLGGKNCSVRPHNFMPREPAPAQQGTPVTLPVGELSGHILVASGEGVLSMRASGCPMSAFSGGEDSASAVLIRKCRFWRKNGDTGWGFRGNKTFFWLLSLIYLCFGNCHFVCSWSQKMIILPNRAFLHLG